MTTSGWSIAERMLDWALSKSVAVEVQPILKPLEMPWRINREKALSGWEWRLWAHALGRSGVTISRRWEGRLFGEVG